MASVSTPCNHCCTATEAGTHVFVVKREGLASDVQSAAGTVLSSVGSGSLRTVSWLCKFSCPLNFLMGSGLKSKAFPTKPRVRSCRCRRNLVLISSHILPYLAQPPLNPALSSVAAQPHADVALDFGSEQVIGAYPSRHPSAYRALPS